MVMDTPQIHFEVFARRPGASSHHLELATEDRAKAMSTAEEMLASGRAVAVKVTKEVLDPHARAFKSVTVLNKGAPDRKAAKPAVELAPLCVCPADLYTGHARERIGELLEDWLGRNRATPWELLHRPDLIELLEASGVEVQHALQKVAVPEAQARGRSVHDMMRHFQQLADAAIARVLKDGRKSAFPDLAKESFAAACTRLREAPERHYLLGGAVAACLAGASGWRDKIDRLLDLADAAPGEGAARATAFAVLEKPLGEIVGSRLGLAELLGPELDLGGSLAALTRLAAGSSVDVLIRADPALAQHLPPLSGAALRLAGWLDARPFQDVRAAVGQRVLRELRGRRRLRPGDPRGEIDMLRALAMALTTAAGKLLPLEDVRQAFTERSKTIVSADFVESFLGEGRPAMEEARDLVWLLENVTGVANRRQAARWLHSSVSSLRFETEMRGAGESPAARLAALADLQRGVARVGADVPECQQAFNAIGTIGGQVEADARLVYLISHAAAPVVQRLSPLLKLAAGESAPLGPAADRAKAEAIRLLRSAEGRAACAAAPETFGRLRDLMPAADAA
jgi:hypothetical protein